jgi:hypothetical protein
MPARRRSSGSNDPSPRIADEAGAADDRDWMGPSDVVIEVRALSAATGPDQAVVASFLRGDGSKPDVPRRRPKPIRSPG